MRNIYIILCLICIAHSAFASESDTIPPVIVTHADSLLLPCGNPVEASLSDWYKRFGGFTVVDEGGEEEEGENEVEYFSTIEFEDIVEIIESLPDTFCGNTTELLFGFYAVDNCGNVSDTSYGLFALIDLASPNIIESPQNLTLSCQPGIQDSIQNWLDNRGFAEVEDSCSDSIIWLSYFWSDGNGNSGLGNFDDPHEIVLAGEECERIITVSMTVEDECGNATITEATIIIKDEQGPMLVSEVFDTTLSCTENLEEFKPIFIDICDDTTNVFIFEESTQGSNPDSCDFYNYSITREYFTEDACGNSNTAAQVIMVVDTTGPFVRAFDTVNITCSQNIIDPDDFFLQLEDCSEIQYTVSDSSVTTGNCNQELIRTWIFSDVCGNTTEFEQFVRRIDTIQPAIENPPHDLEFDCDQLSTASSLVKSYLDSLIRIPVSDNCSNTLIKVFDSSIGEDYIIDVGFFPFFGCEEENTLLFQEDIVVQILDDCQNDTSYISNIAISNNNLPEFENCDGSPREFILDEGTCDTTIWIQALDINESCDVSENEIYLYKKIKAENFSENGILMINVTRSLDIPDFVELSEEGTIRITLNNLVQKEEDGITILLQDEETDFVIEEMIQIENCATESIDFNVPENIINIWKESGKFNLSGGIGGASISEDCEGDPTVDFELTIGFSQSLVALNEVDLGNGSFLEIIDSIQVNLEAGNQTVIFRTTDCSGNVITCNQNFTIVDEQLPQISCPSDTIVFVADDNCSVSHKLSQEIEFIENCRNTFSNTDTLPDGEGFIQFIENEDGQLIPNNILLRYEDIVVENQIINPILIVRFRANTKNDNAYFSIRDEDGNEIGQTPQSELSCEQIIEFELDLNEEDFVNWQEDGQINFTFVHPNGQETGLEPCNRENLENQIDETSFLKAILAYTEVNPSIEVTDEDGNSIDINEENEVDLEVGDYTVTLDVEDISGNAASCNYNISVLDEIPPVLECEDFSIELPVVIPDTLFSDPEIFVENFMDNCTEVSLSLEVEDLDCSSLSEPLEVTITAEDEHGNSSSCVSNLNFTLAELNPSFSSSLCGGDTLLLFSNIEYGDSDEILNFNWSGPLNFSSEAADPIITNVVVQNSGIYLLEVTNSIGCVYTGTVEILIESLDSPEISASSDIICEGEGIILNSNSFSDEVTYAWYEGVSPNGILLGETPGPSFEISPTLGEHNYYVIAIGPNCESNASNTYTVEVIQTPVAEVEEIFITVCEGEDITLSGSNFDPSLEYIWTGPNGYSGTGITPETIINSTVSNQGDYELVVVDRGCISEPAVVTVAIFGKPITPIISGDNIVCAGSPLVLSVVNNTTANRYRWLLNEIDQGATSDNTFIIANSTESLSGAWTVIIEDQQGCTSDPSEPFIVVVEDEINIGATNSGPVCDGDDVTLTATFNPNAVYVWTAPNNQVYEGQIVTVPSIEGIYNLMVTTLTGCEAETSTEVIVEDIPTITALTNTSGSCMEIGETFTFSPSVFPTGNYEYNWTGPNGFSSNEQNPIVTYEGPQNNGTYTLEVLIGSCSTEPSTTNVDINPAPTTPIITGINTVCPGDEVTLMVTEAVDGAEYTWNTPLGQVITNVPMLNIPAANSSDQGNYTVLIDLNGCISENSDIFVVTIFDELTSPFIVGENEVCEGDLVILTVTPEITEGNYIWTLPDGSLFTGSMIDFGPAQLNNAGAYSVIADLNGCQSNESIDFILTVNEAPLAPALDNSEFTFCADISNVTIDIGSPATGGTFEIYNPDGTLLSSSDTGIFENLSLADFTTSPIILEVGQTLDGCTSLENTVISITLEEVPSDAPTFVTEELIICNLGTQTIDINVPNSVSNIEVEIIGDNVILTSFDFNAIIVEVVDEGEATIIITGSSDLCENFASAEFTLNFEDIIYASEDDEFNFDGLVTPVSLDILSNDEIGTEYTIEIIDITQGVDAEIVNDQLVINSVPNQTEEINISYEICDLNCIDNCSTTTVIIRIGTSEGCDATNLLTPNGDGANDLLVVPCAVPGSPDIVELQIFNQWGDRIFNTQDYQNDWDGTYNGEVLPVGTYYYAIKVNDSERRHGFIVIEL